MTKHTPINIIGVHDNITDIHIWFLKRAKVYTGKYKIKYGNPCKNSQGDNYNVCWYDDIEDYFILHSVNTTNIVYIKFNDLMNSGILDGIKTVCIKE